MKKTRLSYRTLLKKVKSEQQVEIQYRILDAGGLNVTCDVNTDNTNTVRFIHCTIKNAVFVLSSSTFIEFQNCILQNVTIRDATLYLSHDKHHVNIIGCRLSGCDIQEAKIMHIVDSTVKYTHFHDIKCVDIGRSTFMNSNFRCISAATMLYNITCTKCSFYECHLYDCNTNESHFNDCEYMSSPCFYQKCPREGSYIAYKKARIYPDDDSITSCLVKLLVLEDAKRSSAMSLKCRASKVKVLDITSLDESQHYNTAYSIFAKNFCYEVGKTIEVKYFDENRWNECARGIHHFVDKQAAIDFTL